SRVWGIIGLAGSEAIDLAVLEDPAALVIDRVVLEDRAGLEVIGLATSVIDQAPAVVAFNAPAASAIDRGGPIAPAPAVVVFSAPVAIDRAGRTGRVAPVIVGLATETGPTGRTGPVAMATVGPVTAIGPTGTTVLAGRTGRTGAITSATTLE